jgi:hypothetical protein
MFSPSVAQILGIDIERGRLATFHGLRGTIEAYIHRIDLQLGDRRLRARVAFPELEIPNILGRLDILKRSSILFRDEKEVCFEY